MKDSKYGHTLKWRLASFPLVRFLCLKILRLIARDITIINPWSNEPLLLNSFIHKGYWYYGKEREFETMNWFQELIPEGGTVLEVGGHIGFITQYFSRLAGDHGLIIVFEPGSNNLPYIRKNVRKANIRLVELAISNTEGEAILYEDNITGQNNSLLSNFKGAEEVAKTHNMTLRRNARSVEVTTLDTYIRKHDLTPDFIKIDIEGNELNALLGAYECLSKIKSIMVEVNQNHGEITAILKKHGFRLFNHKREELQQIKVNGNFFCLKK